MLRLKAAQSMTVTMNSSHSLRHLFQRSSPPSKSLFSSIKPLVSYRKLSIASASSLNKRLQLSKPSSLRSRFWSRISGGVRASSSDSGSIDSPMMQSMENKIKEQLNAETVVVKDAYGDGRHVSIYVVSDAFEGQSAVNRQRMVYKAIWEELQSTVHAVDQMITSTPSEVK